MDWSYWTEVVSRADCVRNNGYRRSFLLRSVEPPIPPAATSFWPFTSNSLSPPYHLATHHFLSAQSKLYIPYSPFSWITLCELCYFFLDYQIIFPSKLRLKAPRESSPCLIFKSTSRYICKAHCNFRFITGNFTVNFLWIVKCTIVGSGSSEVDPDLRSVLELATDSELYELQRILFGPR